MKATCLRELAEWSDVYVLTAKEDRVGTVWQQIPVWDCSSFGWSRIENKRKGDSYDSFEWSPFQRLVWVPKWMQGGDYSGGILEMANKKEFLSQFGDKEGVWELFGGCGSFGVAIDLETCNLDEDIIATLQALEDYPCMDDQVVSELEMEAVEENYDNWMRHDLEKALMSKLRQEVEDAIDWDESGMEYEEAAILMDSVEEDLQQRVDEKLANMDYFYILCERANRYPENESGDSMWVDIEALVKRASMEDFT